MKIFEILYPGFALEFAKHITFLLFELRMRYYRQSEKITLLPDAIKIHSCTNRLAKFLGTYLKKSTLLAIA